MNLEEFSANYSHVHNFEAQLAEFKRIRQLSKEALLVEFRASTSSIGWLHIEALVDLGESVTPELIAIMQDPDSEITWKAAHALGAINNEAAFSALIEALDDPKTCRDAFSALVRTGDARAFAPLITVLEDGRFFVNLYDEQDLQDEQVLKIIAEEKKEILDYLPTNLEKHKLCRLLAKSLGLAQDDYGLHAVIMAYQETGISVPVNEPVQIFNNPSIAAYLIYNIKNIPERVDFVPAYHARLIQGLVRMGKIAFPLVLELLQDEEADNQEVAVMILDEMGDERAIQPLIEYLERQPDPGSWGYIRAVELLEKFGVNRTVKE